jgi:hypothetical protein
LFENLVFFAHSPRKKRSRSTLFLKSARALSLSSRTSPETGFKKKHRRTRAPPPLIAEQQQKEHSSFRGNVHEQIHASRERRKLFCGDEDDDTSRRGRGRGREEEEVVSFSSEAVVMLGSAARKERKERKKREKKAGGGGGGGASKSSSSVVSSSQGTHDSAQTLTNDKTPISPIPEAATPQSKAKKSAEAMNTSGDSTTTASTAAADKKKKKKSKDTPSEEEESLLQKRWFRWLAGAACSIAAVSTGTKLWMRKEENVQVKKEDVATPAAAGAKKKRGN